MTNTPLALLGFFCGALMACSSIGSPAAPAELLQLEVEVETTVDAPDHGPLLRIHVRNTGSQSIAFSETFGFENLYLRIALERMPGEIPIEYPANSQYELFSTPRYQCLHPGETTTIELAINGWYHIYGGRLDVEQGVPEPGPYSFRLGPGSYRVRAIYSSPDEEARRGCRRLLGRQESEWVDFTVPE